MSTGKRISVFLVSTLMVLLARPAFDLYKEGKKALSEDPTAYELDIAAFEKADEKKFPAAGSVVFVGSSSIRLWKTLHEDMAPIPVIQRGFGGAKINDVVHYTHRIVTPYVPRAIVVFAGTNDITPRGAKTPEALLTSYKKLIGRVRSELPDTPLYYIAITPSPARWKIWPIAQQANQLISEFSNGDTSLHVIDTGSALMDDSGKPDRGNYIFDGLHLSSKGYAIWASLIRPELEQYYPEASG